VKEAAKRRKRPNEKTFVLIQKSAEQAQQNIFLRQKFSLIKNQCEINQKYFVFFLFHKPQESVAYFQKMKVQVFFKETEKSLLFHNRLFLNHIDQVRQVRRIGKK
jgi:hypothetical protein